METGFAAGAGIRKQIASRKRHNALHHFVGISSRRLHLANIILRGYYAEKRLQCFQIFGHLQKLVNWFKDRLVVDRPANMVAS